MTLYQKVNGQFQQLSPQAEAAARANPNSKFGNDSGYETLLTSAEVQDLAAFQAAAAAAAQQANASSGGPILVSPSGAAFRLSINDDGSLNTEQAT